MIGELVAQATAVTRSARLPFLLLTPACVGLGLSAVRYEEFALQPRIAGLAAGVGVATHIGVNAFNEYRDFRSGLDLNTRRTPFSGGSGALPGFPRAQYSVLGLSIVVMLIAAWLGLVIVIERGWPALAIGVTGLVIALTYTDWINRSALLCLLSPGIAFGPLMVSGTAFAAAGHWSGAAGAVSLVVLFLVSALLLRNQIPDIGPDRQVGRRHWGVCYGVESALGVWRILLGLAILAMAGATLAGVIPVASMLGAVPVLILLWLGRDDPPSGSAPRFPVMAMNAAVATGVPTFLAMVLMMG